MNELTPKIEEKLEELDLQREAFISKIKRAMSNNQRIKIEENLLVYFSYSCNLTNLRDEENYIIGSVIIHNYTSQPIKQLSIGLVVDSEQVYQFTGKYVTDNSQSGQKTPVNWKRISDDNDHHTYWFQWIGKDPIASDSIVSFSNFSLSWESNHPFSCSVKGFVYTDDYRDGVKSNNEINVQLS